MRLRLTTFRYFFFVETFLLTNWLHKIGLFINYIVSTDILRTSSKVSWARYTSNSLISLPEFTYGWSFCYKNFCSSSSSGDCLRIGKETRKNEDENEKNFRAKKTFSLVLLAIASAKAQVRDRWSRALGGRRAVSVLSLNYGWAMAVHCDTRPLPPSPRCLARHSANVCDLCWDSQKIVAGVRRMKR